MKQPSYTNSADGSEPAVESFGVKVPASPFLNATRIARIAEGRYERQEIQGALALVGPSDRVLEMGAGLGIVGAVVAQNAKPKAVLSYEANPALVPHIRRLHALNGLSDRIELRNRVLLAEPDPPAEAEFHVGGSFLGASLVAASGQTVVTHRIPTDRFDDVRADFKPTVLIMDIEGGELEFLSGADLSGIRAVIVEFHPKVYGKTGMQRCKGLLQKAGFVRIAEHSTRWVWACARVPEGATPSNGRGAGSQVAPDPAGGWSTEVTELADAIVVPPSQTGFVVPAGVLDARGSYCAAGAVWRKHRVLTTPPVAPDVPVARLPGRWLWGGVLFGHFGHFIVESTARLWAVPELSGQIDGVLFIPRRAGDADLAKPFHDQVFDLVQRDMPVRTAVEPLQVERLFVPGQGFGLGKIASGTDLFRQTMRDHFARDVAPDGPERLYISRSRISLSRGTIIGEGLLESHLARHGYHVFHPQEHDIATQVARYKAARSIVGTEGSALHLAGMVARADQRIALVIRRHSSATRYIARHIEGMAGRAPTLVDALTGHWAPRGARRKHMFLGATDLDHVRAALLLAGFIDRDPGPWSTPAFEQTKKQLGPKYQFVPL